MQHTSNVVETTTSLFDPLADYSPFSFHFSSSLPSLPNPTPSSLLSHLKHLALRNPDSIVNQAKTIKEGVMGLVENDTTRATAIEEQNVVPIAVNDKKPRERRPALDFKPAKFQMKPLPSEPDVIVESTIDLDSIKDPVELFATFEKMEKAEKEIRRLKGLPLVDIDQNRAALHRRPRRPTIWGKSVKYVHHPYPSLGGPDKDVPLLSSQEVNDNRIMSPTHEDVIPEIGAMNNSTGVSDVKMATGSKGSELDELLSLNYDGLDEDGVQRLLQDKLNIKPVDVGKLSLPDMPDFRSREALPKLTGTLYGVHDSTKNDSSNARSFGYQFKKSSSSNLISPSLPKSPFASISSLSKHVSKISQSKDPYSPLDIGSSLGLTTYLETRNRKQADQIGKNTDSHDFSRLEKVSAVDGEHTNGVVTSLPGFVLNSTIPNDESKEQLDGVSHSKDSHEIERSPARSEENISVPGIIPSPIAKETTPIGDPEECLDSPTDGEVNLPVSDEALLAVAVNDVDLSSALIEQEDQIAVDPKPVGKESLSKGPAVEKASVNGACILEETVNKGKKEKAKSSAPVQKESKNKKRKVGVSPRPSIVNEKLRRHSLYEAGTKWEAGLRRSTRIRMRPLEFWRGERFLYGRVHKSMVSVIGVKYASPTKDAEEPAVKVKSFVSDEFKNLLDLASSH